MSDWHNDPNHNVDPTHRDPGPSVDPQTVQAHIERSLARESVNRDVRQAFRDAQDYREAVKRYDAKVSYSARLGAWFIADDEFGTSTYDTADEARADAREIVKTHRKEVTKGLARLAGISAIFAG